MTATAEQLSDQAPPPDGARAGWRGGVTSTTFSRGLGIATLVGLVWLVLFGLVFSPEDRVQGTSVRIMYIHVPTAWIAYLAFIVTGVSSALYLFRRAHACSIHLLGRRHRKSCRAPLWECQFPSR